VGGRQTFACGNAQLGAANVSSDELEFNDGDPNKGFSVAREALTELEMLDMNLLTAADIPFFVAFLKQRSGRIRKGLHHFRIGAAGNKSQEAPG